MIFPPARRAASVAAITRDPAGTTGAPAQPAFMPAPSLTAAELTDFRARSAAQLMLVAALAVAGVVHLALVSEHLRESIVLGGGFLGAGLGQIGLAAILLRHPTTMALRLALWLSVSSLAVLAAAVTVGLPALLHGSMAGGFEPAETLTDLGAITGLAEVIAFVLAIRILRRDRQPRDDLVGRAATRSRLRNQALNES